MTDAINSGKHKANQINAEEEEIAWMHAASTQA